MAEEKTNISGVVHKMFPTEQLSEKFSKRVIVIKTEGEYPQLIPIQFTNKNIDKLDKITTGQFVSVGYNLRGNEYKEKFYASIEGWMIKVENKQVDMGSSSTQQSKVTSTDDGSGLPF
jgi:hypothetical protein